MGGGRWEVVVAELPCTIELGQDGGWVVTLASVSVSRNESLATAIVNAGGGLVDVDEATAIATRVAESLLPRRGPRARRSMQ
jgi:hypothetical protein